MDFDANNNGIPATPDVLVITGQNVILTSQQSGPEPYTLVIAHGKIQAVYAGHTTLDQLPLKLADLTASKQLDWSNASALPLSHALTVGYWELGSLWLIPGIVDAHVHVNQPGRTLWEGMATATRAAAAGGCTTIVDMPLNSIPPTTTVANANAKLVSVRDSCWVDVALWGGLVPENQAELVPLVQWGVCGFKGFLIESGVDEFPMVQAKDVEGAMQVLESSGGRSVPLLFHAELASCMCSNPPVSQVSSKHDTTMDSQSPQEYTTFLDSRPPEMEVAAIQQVINWLQHHPTLRGHIVHLSAAEAIPLIQEAKTRGVNLTVETCFHYLALNAEEVPKGATQFKCCPPIRNASNREALWQALETGVIDMVVSDHSPSTPDLKCPEEGDFMKAWGGISSVQFGLPVLWTAARRRGHKLTKLVQWLCEKPATHVQLSQHKGHLAVGMDADMVVWDPHAAFSVSPSSIHFRYKQTPYMHHQLYGVVHHTLLRGQVVFTRNGLSWGDTSRIQAVVSPANEVAAAPIKILVCQTTTTSFGDIFTPKPFGRVIRHH
ncbi:Allantoinase [Dispira parvispora]|uniref:allantoinase n=1 Tax=Dispira parvispora TaxID=1520584 RepID=A0A9W8ATX8_9FUNG|nr:Allantoinase [Dispira parvispora]